VSSPLELLDSIAWRAGVLHERERIIKVLRFMKEELMADCRGLSRDELRGAIGVLDGVSQGLREAG
jgi:phosphoenolpyruvate carboxylase